VLALQPVAVRGGHDEELRAVGVRASVRHRELAAIDIMGVLLVLELVARATRARAVRAAALDHEVGDHTVEDQAVIKSLTGELGEVLYGLRGVIRVELDDDGSHAGLHVGASCHCRPFVRR